MKKKTDLSWISDTIIHKPIKPVIFDSNYLFPIEYLYLIEKTTIYYICRIRPTSEITEKDIDLIHKSIHKKIKKQYPNHTISLTLSDDGYEKFGEEIFGEEKKNNSN